MILVGRPRELETLADTLATRTSGGRALVVRGPAGMGKTALLASTVERAQEHRAARAAGSPAERDLPFAGLHATLRPFLDRLDDLPAPQAAALRAAFGLGPAGGPPHRFLVALGALSLLAEAAGEQPVVCVCDDAQWLDQESLECLAFVARRLGAEAVTMLFGLRDDDDSVDHASCLNDLPTLTLGPLDADAARALLGAAISGPVDEAAARRVLLEAAGNPLALRELATDLRLFGEDAPLADRLPLGRQLEAVYRRRWATLPDATRDLVVVAAADSTGDPVLVREAARVLGIARDAAGFAAALAPAALVDLLDPWPSVAFGHPLARTAVLGAAPDEALRAAHAALAAVTDASLEPDRRAWHLAAATAVPDDAIAAELEAAARRARGRGGPSTEAAFLARAAELSARPGESARRRLAASRAALEAGQPDRARALLDGIVDPALADPVTRLRTDAAIRMALGRSDEALGPLVRAAEAITDADPVLARDTLLDAFTAVVLMPWLPPSPSPADVAKVATTLPPAPGRSDAAADALLAALAARAGDGYARAAPLMRTALPLALATDPPESLGRWYLLAVMTADDLWDDAFLTRLARRTADGARRSGALDVLRLAEHTLGNVAVWRGDLAAAQGHFDTFREVSRMIGGSSRFAEPSDAILHAWRGDADGARAAADMVSAPPFPGAAGGLQVQMARSALGLLEIGRGRYGEALAALRPILDDDPPCHGSRCLADAVEAGVRSGDRVVAHEALDRLRERAPRAGTPWATSALARAEAIVAEGDGAEVHHRDAIEHLATSDLVTERARAHLLFGEWLRRQKRRTEARDQLTQAFDVFSAIGAAGFAERARAELAATGLVVTQRASAGSDAHLTVQEAHVAALAAEGLTNRDIAAQLYLSPATVEYHLRKVFRKLGVTSRRELRGRSWR